MPQTRVNLTDVRTYFRPERVAQRIVDRESYGTPATDTFYPERTRSNWDDVVVPVEEITRRTRAVPLVLRGAPGVTVSGDGGGLSLIKPQPIKTIDGMTAAEYNNRRMFGRESVDQLTGRITDRHTDTHRKTREALCAQSLTGRIDFPIAGKTGQIIDVFSVKFGDTRAFVVAADWTAEATTLGQIHKDLSNARTERSRAGYGTTDVYVGRDLFGALLDKVSAIGNDTRFSARVRDDGAIQIGSFVVMEMAEQYDHPGLPDFGQPGGAVVAGYKDVIGPTEVLMTDASQEWSLLNVRLDNFLLPPNPAPLGVIVDMARDGGQIDLYFESKPFPIPVAPAITRFDATATA